MELWQIEIMGGVFLVDGSQLKLVTGIDDHSRFRSSAKALRRATARPVCDALAEAMRRHSAKAHLVRCEVLPDLQCMALAHTELTTGLCGFGMAGTVEFS